MTSYWGVISCRKPSKAALDKDLLWTTVVQFPASRALISHSSLTPPPRDTSYNLFQISTPECCDGLDNLWQSNPCECSKARKMSFCAAPTLSATRWAFINSKLTFANVVMDWIGRKARKPDLMMASRDVHQCNKSLIILSKLELRLERLPASFPKQTSALLRKWALDRATCNKG